MQKERPDIWHSLKKEPNTLIGWLIPLMAFCASMEFLYSPGSGTYNRYILILFAGVLTGLRFWINPEPFKFTKWELASFALLAWIVIWGANRESIRYGLTFYIILALRWFRYPNLRFFHIGLILVGTLRTLIGTSTDGRVVGFMTGSPTLFSFVLVIAIYYLLFTKNQKKRDFVYVALAAYCTYKTGSRTNILAVAGLMAYWVFEQYLRMRKRTDKKIWYLVDGAIILAIVVLLFTFDFKKFMTGRASAQGSTNSRVYMIGVVLDEIVQNPAMLILGRGGGYAVKLLAYDGGHLPLHQDLLMLICEYGVVGTALILTMFFCKPRPTLMAWAILAVGSFHNMIISSISVLWFFLTVIALKEEGLRDELFVRRKKVL